MRIGVFADTHDHLEHIRLAVREFRRREVELVLFAGDFVSSIALPPLRELPCRLIACWGDNEGNRIGVEAGMRILGEIGEGPFGYRSPDGCRILLCHMLRQVQGDDSDCDVVVYAHTHRPAIARDSYGRLFVNPGETSGWTSGRPTIAVIETNPLSAEIIDLRPAPAASNVE